MEVKELDPRPRGMDHLSRRGKVRGLSGDQSHPQEFLLFEFIDGLLLLVDLIPKPGQLPVVGLPVTLHL